jgi:putative restriction endonuclease
MQKFDLEVGRGYTKAELEAIFGTRFGARIKGITLRRDIDNSPYALVFSREDGPYTDRMEGNSFFYDGEGTNKDQELTAANKALTEANEAERTIFGFRQKEEKGLWVYLGILQVLEYSYFRKNGFLTYEFHFETVPVTPAELVGETEHIQQITQTEPTLTQETHKVAALLTARSAAFRKGVKMAYDNTCAVCKMRRVSVAGYPEVEAAHIYPKEKDGADDYRNGIALCKLHHWAFDSGLLAISDDMKIIVRQAILQDENYDEITKFAGKDMMVPKHVAARPHLIFVRAHRELHGL